ncbi:hypothetical protein [Psychrobacter sp. I-STPA6b]|uniref:hypothetical protein n=1 Tax=Psychrobacter sp. I-STPA6b TaxID=2585718 RepID=UPI001D0C82C3|nr:hypothetical protein [Psychrobacter sp. I-STPA6b]
MILKNKQLLKIAEKNLTGMLRNHSYQDLDLPCEVSQLDKSDWQIQYHINTEYYEMPVHILSVSFLSQKNIIASYKLYLDNSLNCIDEFFVTY